MSRPAAAQDVPCNLCGAREYDVVARRDRHRRPLQTVICRACGLVFVNPRPSDAEMDRYYATEYRADYTGAAAPPTRKILRGLIGARDRLRSLRPLLGDPAARRAAGTPAPKLLDVGCGAGELVYLLRRERVDAAGLEPGQDYADFARRVFQIPIQTATVGTADVPADSQDVVTMFHALEHVPDPRGVLATVRNWVRRGGFVVVEVPNIESTVQAPSNRFHYAHLHHFSATTLGALGEAAGLRLVRTYLSDDGGNVTAVFRRVGDDARLPAGLEAHAARLRALVVGHTPLGHFLTVTPYRRAVEKLRRRWREDRLLSRLKRPEDVVRWADDNP